MRDRYGSLTLSLEYCFRWIFLQQDLLSMLLGEAVNWRGVLVTPVFQGWSLSILIEEMLDHTWMSPKVPEGLFELFGAFWSFLGGGGGSFSGPFRGWGADTPKPFFVQTAINWANTCVYSMYWVDTFKPILATSRVILELNPFGILIRRAILTGKPMVPCVL